VPCCRCNSRRSAATELAADSVLAMVVVDRLGNLQRELRKRESSRARTVTRVMIPELRSAAYSATSPLHKGWPTHRAVSALPRHCAGLVAVHRPA
jgi:hypothetical protein